MLCQAPPHRDKRQTRGGCVKPNRAVSMATLYQPGHYVTLDRGKVWFSFTSASITQSLVPAIITALTQEWLGDKDYWIMRCLVWLLDLELGLFMVVGCNQSQLGWITCFTHCFHKSDVLFGAFIANQKRKCNVCCSLIPPYLCMHFHCR